MARLNLTLDPDTAARLERHARQARTPRAALARRLLVAALEQEEEAEHRRRLAADYAAGRKDAREVLAGFEGAQAEWEE